MGAVVVSGEIRIDPEDHEAALGLVEPLVAATRAEPGCVAYGFWVDPRDPGRIRIFEEWASEAALEAHAASAHLAEFTAAIATIRVLDVALTRYDVTDRRPI